MSVLPSDFALEFNPVVLVMTVGRPNVSSDNVTSNFSGNHTGDFPKDEGNSNVYETYALYKITYYMADYYLWVVLAFGVPGNLASIFTILSMTTVSSSKVNTYVLRHRPSAVDPPQTPKIRPCSNGVDASNDIQRPKIEIISTNANSRRNKTVITMSAIGGRKSVTTVNTHVAILALTDTVAIIVKVIYWQASGHYVQLTTPGCTLIMFIQQFSTVYANWVVVAMTTERFLAVWFPLRVGRMYTRRKAIFTLASLAFITMAVYFFFFWSWREYHAEDYGYWCEMTKEYTNFVMNSFYWIDGLYYAILPCLLILIGNTLIITNIKRATTIQRHLTNSFDQGARKARDQRQITVMLVVVSVIFLLLNMPSAIFYIVKPYWTYQEYSYEHVKFMFVNRFIHVLADANHAVNFYLYFLSMSSFRRRFMDAIRCRNNMYARPVGGSVSRTSHSFLNSAHHATGYCRRMNNGGYNNTYKHSSNKNIQHALPLETYKSKTNGATFSHQMPGFSECVTNASEV